MAYFNSQKIIFKGHSGSQEQKLTSLPTLNLFPLKGTFFSILIFMMPLVDSNFLFSEF